MGFSSPSVKSTVEGGRRAAWPSCAPPLASRVLIGVAPEVCCHGKPQSISGGREDAITTSREKASRRTASGGGSQRSLDVRILPACAIPSILVILAHPMASDLSVRVEKAAGGDPTFRSPSRAGSRGARQQAYGTHFGASTSSMPLLDGVTVSPLNQRADRHAGGAPLPGTVGAASATRTSRLMHARIALAQQKKEFSRMNVSNLREAGAVSRAGRYAYPMV